MLLSTRHHGAFPRVQIVLHLLARPLARLLSSLQVQPSADAEAVAEAAQDRGRMLVAWKQLQAGIPQGLSPGRNEISTCNL